MGVRQQGSPEITDSLMAAQLHAVNADRIIHTVLHQLQWHSTPASMSMEEEENPQDLLIQSLRTQLTDISTQVTLLNTKLVTSYNRISDLEDELHVSQDGLKASTTKVKDLEERVGVHQTELMSGSLVSREEITHELSRVMERATEEAAQRGLAEEAKQNIEKEIGDLSESLFVEAGRMVRVAKEEKEESERRMRELEKEVQMAEEAVAVLQNQLTEKVDSPLAQQAIPLPPIVLARREVRFDIPPYIQFTAFVAHLKSLKTSSPSSTPAPTLSSLISQPFLVRLVTEDSDPTLHLDTAPALNWISRRAVMNAVYAGQLDIEPLSLTGPYSHPITPSTACALCGVVVRPHTAYPHLPTDSNPIHAFKLPSTNINTAVSTISKSGPLPPSPALTIYPLCSAAYCLPRLRTTCTLWAYIRSAVIDHVWISTPLRSPPHILSTLAARSAVGGGSITPPPVPPRRRITPGKMSMSGLWGALKRDSSSGSVVVSPAATPRSSSSARESIEEAPPVIPEKAKESPIPHRLPPPLPRRSDGRSPPLPPPLPPTALDSPIEKQEEEIELPEEEEKMLVTDPVTPASPANGHQDPISIPLPPSRPPTPARSKSRPNSMALVNGEVPLQGSPTKSRIRPISGLVNQLLVNGNSDHHPPEEIAEESEAAAPIALASDVFSDSVQVTNSLSPTSAPPPPVPRRAARRTAPPPEKVVSDTDVTSPSSATTSEDVERSSGGDVNNLNVGEASANGHTLVHSDDELHSPIRDATKVVETTSPFSREAPLAARDADDTESLVVEDGASFDDVTLKPHSETEQIGSSTPNGIHANTASMHDSEIESHSSNSHPMSPIVSDIDAEPSTSVTRSELLTKPPLPPRRSFQSHAPEHSSDLSIQGMPPSDSAKTNVPPPPPRRVYPPPPRHPQRDSFKGELKQEKQEKHEETWEERTWIEITRLREEMFWARIGGREITVVDSSE